MQGLVERHVGPHQIDCGALWRKRLPVCQRIAERGDLGRLRFAAADADGRQPSGKAVERFPYLLEPPDADAVQRRHRQSTAPMLYGQPAMLQQLQGVADRLARHVEQFRDTFLGQPFARRKTPDGDRLHELVMHLIDKRGFGANRVEHGLLTF